MKQLILFIARKTVLYTLGLYGTIHVSVTIAHESSYILGLLVMWAGYASLYADFINIKIRRGK